MKYEDLIKLIDAGFTKEDIMKLGQNQEEKKEKEEPKKEKPKKEEPTPPTFDIDALVTKVADEIDARTAKRQQANRTKDLSNEQTTTVEDPSITDVLKNFLG